MKNLSIAIAIIATFFGSFTLNAQQHLKKHALTVSPYQAFTQNGEMQLGYEEQHSVKGALELNFGFRFKGSDDPQRTPYFHQTLESSTVKQVQKGVQFFLFIPLPVVGKDKDWTEKTEQREYYTNHNIFVSGGYKFYLLPAPNRRVPGGLYLTPGLTIGNRGISEYIYAEGQKGYFTKLSSNTWSDGGDWGPILGFVGNEKVVREDVYDFTRLEIKQHNKTYLQPHLKLGYQLPIGSSLSADLGVQGMLNDRYGYNTTGKFFRLDPTVKLGLWF